MPASTAIWESVAPCSPSLAMTMMAASISSSRRMSFTERFLRPLFMKLLQIHRTTQLHTDLIYEFQNQYIARMAPKAIGGAYETARAHPQQGREHRARLDSPPRWTQAG